ncbi:helix-turn-helix domain-containing protein [Leifsonia sp. Root112D2]|uniref:helix-turn-helix domain-containing protein n=1 Tax=Leifsonia sp. Root112D2 TaxID=1736426 RepID=UPI0006F9DB93|nr:helix-turn-helix transcriptional regulator [Leifsonia sp. Root112D2]KQV07597.1 hypothetical protein ASC63_10175 [Leifsonia sp. Root112D2]
MVDPLSRATHELGERILARRLSLGATQEEVASGAEVDTTTIGKIERGERNPNVHNLIRIADALQLDPGDLISGMTRDMVPPRVPKPSALERLRGKQGVDPAAPGRGRD